MDLLGKKKERERDEFLIKVYDICKEISGSLKRIQKELDNDRICGHWENEIFSASVFKMNMGYLISIWKIGALEAQLTVTSDDEGLIINDSDIGRKQQVRYDPENRELTIDGYGNFWRDFENLLQPVEVREETPDLYEEFLSNYSRTYPLIKAFLDEKLRALKMSWKDYRNTFLSVSKEPLIKRVYLSAPAYERIRDILPQLDVTLTVSAYVENIVANHLKTFEDDINEWVE